ncbi:class E sortase [Streptomyces sp. NPDC087270]|uniref:class E sortase n=1 Tax=Streptomyces sp. NPDC087270 TaxID=3365774 RepID=UPI00382464F0
MTTLRPERASDGPMSYEDTGQFEVAVGQLADPLNDPLPGRPPVVEGPPQPLGSPGPLGSPQHQGPPQSQPQGPQGPPQSHGSPWFRAEEMARQPQPEPMAPPTQPPPAQPAPIGEPAAPDLMPGPVRSPAPAPAPAPAPEPLSVPEPDETAQMPLLADADGPGPTATLAPVPGSPGAGPAGVDGGRAARRKAAARGGGHRARGRNGPSTAAANAAAGSAAEHAEQQPAVPLSRVEARRAAKAAKDSPAVVISRIVGELFISLGVVMLLFVTYQLWWTNVRAHAQANSASNNLEHQWDSGSGDPSRAAGTFSPGQGFAIMYIPKLDVKAPIAQGVSTTKVLNKGMIGHYDGAPVNTAMPWDKTGNFAVAAHRNTHGEPFRYINHLVAGDQVVVETSTTYYTYTVTSSLATTPPSNVSVLEPVPPGSGFTKPGRYITLTTCTPEFTSTNRLIVWGKLTEERARSKGKPDALVNG